MTVPTIYIDTSVISHLAHEDTPDKMQETWQLWQAIKDGRFKACISDVTLEEIRRCPEPKRSKLLGYLATIETVYLEDREAITTLTDKYIEFGVLTKKNIDDCQHIATASIHECDYIVSWNFRHFLDKMTSERVHTVNGLCGYCKPQILSPKALLEKECKS